MGESVQKPAEYYMNNVAGTIVLIQEMKKAGVWNFVFSSSATVYGDPEIIPITEDCKVGGTTNPYGTSKYMVEQILTDVAKAEPQFSMTILRYFNPVGAHASGLIGEDPMVFQITYYLTSAKLRSVNYRNFRYLVAIMILMMAQVYVIIFTWWI